jgi:hypothetical protein
MCLGTVMALNPLVSIAVYRLFRWQQACIYETCSWEHMSRSSGGSWASRQSYWWIQSRITKLSIVLAQSYVHFLLNYICNDKSCNKTLVSTRKKEMGEGEGGAWRRISTKQANKEKCWQAWWGPRAASCNTSANCWKGVGCVLLGIWWRGPTWFGAAASFAEVGGYLYPGEHFGFLETNCFSGFLVCRYLLNFLVTKPWPANLLRVHQLFEAVIN